MATRATVKTKKSNRGGARPGAGRKATRKILTAKPDHELLKALESCVPFVADAVEDLVKGVYIIEKTPKGNVRIYQQPPHAGMILALTDRFLGKVPNRVMHGGDADNNVPIPLIINRPARD